MKKMGCLAALIFVICFFLVSESFAQMGMMWRGSGGWGMGSKYGKMYNPSTVETVRGEIVSISKITPMKGMSSGIHLILKTNKETISVHLGPAWFIESQDIKLKPNEEIEVKGSRITYNGKPAIIAAEIKKGEDVLRLRDKDGFPVWNGWWRKR